jgi:D-glycerate 3-kinase
MPYTPSNEPFPTILSEILPSLKKHLEKAGTARKLRKQPPKPYYLAISGPQGSGKSTVTRQIQEHLENEFELTVLALSIDDFYLGRKELEKRGEGNRLWKQRGPPGTHDVELASRTIDTALRLDEKMILGKGEEPLLIPVYDKAAHLGKGDRAPMSTWPSIMVSAIDVVILEGWCVGFVPVSDIELLPKLHKMAIDMDDQLTKVTFHPSIWSPMEAPGIVPPTFLPRFSVEEIQAMDDALAEYNRTFLDPEKVDVFIKIEIQPPPNANEDELAGVFGDSSTNEKEKEEERRTLANRVSLARSTLNFFNCVVRWRLQQEHALWATGREAMTDEQVKKFVEGYMPAYELYRSLGQRPFFADQTNREAEDIKTETIVLLDGEREVVRLRQPWRHGRVIELVKRTDGLEEQTDDGDTTVWEVVRQRDGDGSIWGLVDDGVIQILR